MPLGAQVNPPASGLRLWLDAGDRVTESGGAVTAWGDRTSDLVPGDTANSSDSVCGEPRLTTYSFSNGPRPALTFDGKDGFVMGNDSDLYLTGEMSIYAVVVPDAGQSQIIIGKYTDVCGFGLGVSDNKVQEIKWFTATPIDSLETG